SVKNRAFAVLCLLALLAGAALGPHLVDATGTLSIPNTLANLASGQQPLSVIDANFTAAKDYLNAREISFGTFAARPAAGVSGRWNRASDINLGPTYADAATAWQQIGAGVPAPTTYTNELASLPLITASATNINVAPGAAA